MCALHIDLLLCFLCRWVLLGKCRFLYRRRARFEDHTIAGIKWCNNILLFLARSFVLFLSSLAPSCLPSLSYPCLALPFFAFSFPALVCLSAWLPVCLSVCLPVSLFCVPLSLCLSVSLSLWLPVFLSLCPSLSLSLSLPLDADNEPHWPACGIAAFLSLGPHPTSLAAPSVFLNFGWRFLLAGMCTMWEHVNQLQRVGLMLVDSHMEPVKPFVKPWVGRL